MGFKISFIMIKQTFKLPAGFGEEEVFLGGAWRLWKCTIQVCCWEHNWWQALNAAFWNFPLYLCGDHVASSQWPCILWPLRQPHFSETTIQNDEIHIFTYCYLIPRPTRLPVVSATSFLVEWLSTVPWLHCVYLPF